MRGKWYSKQFVRLLCLQLLAVLLLGILPISVPLGDAPSAIP
jgi:hypothetical protein